MSMICNLRQVSDSQIESFLKDRAGVKEFLFGPRRASRSLLDMILGRRPPEPKPWTAPGPGEEISLEKAWHGIHYLLTGSDWDGEEPLCYLVKGGEAIPGTDRGYGDAAVLRSEQVKAFAAAVSGITVAELEKRYDPAKMMEEHIYPTIWNNDESDDPKGYVMQYFAELREFLNTTAAKGLGLVVYLS